MLLLYTFLMLVNYLVNWWSDHKFVF